jgi:hypothetical protein
VTALIAASMRIAAYGPPPKRDADAGRYCAKSMLEQAANRTHGKKTSGDAAKEAFGVSATPARVTARGEYTHEFARSIKSVSLTD